MGKVDWVNIGMRIRDIRIARGETREDVSDKLELTGKHIEKVENGSRKFSLEKMIRFSEVYDVSLDYLVFGTVSNDVDKRLVRQHAVAILDLLNEKTE